MRVDNIMSIIENLDGSQLKVEQNAFDAINSSDTSLNLLKDSIKSIEELIGEIKVLDEAVEGTTETVRKMENLSNMITGFANAIASIAKKTNMLSLNASIEAARAGEQGKGFAVVAGEVRSLATQSATSSKEITEANDNIQEFVKEMVNDLKKIFEIVESQNKMVEGIGGALNKVLEATKIANDVSRHMEHEIAYQRDVTDSVREAIQSIAD